MTREMKNSGVQWIGETPSNWTISKIKYIPNSQPDSFVDGDWIESPFITDSGIRYLTSGNIGDGKFKKQGNGYITEATFKILGCKYAYPGDLIFCRLNQPFGRSCVLPDDEDKYVIAVDNVILRTDEEKRYICYLTQTAEYQQNIGLMCNGMAMQRISRTKLGDIKIPLPPLSEQQAIADFLDKKCGEIDGLLEDLDAEIKTLTEYKKSLIAETVTHGLNPNATLVPTNLGWIDEIPQHWKVEKFRYKLTARRVSGFGDKQVLSVYREFGVIPKDSRDDNHNVTSEDTSKYKYVRRGDFVINKMKAWQGSMGVSDYEGIVSPAYFVYEFADSDYEPRFFHYFMRNANNIPEYRRLSGGIREGQWDLSPYDLGNMPIIIPPIEEQKEIISYLDEKCKVIDDTIKDKNDQIDQLKSYKASLIYEYVTGKKQVI